MNFLYSVQQKRHLGFISPAAEASRTKYEIVSLYDSENHFRGPAIFETEKEAEEYLKVYLERMQKRRQDRHLGIKSTSSNNNNPPAQLKVIRLAEIPKLQLSYQLQ
jgi:hypothetical protein